MPTPTRYQQRSRELRTAPDRHVRERVPAPYSRPKDIVTRASYRRLVGVCSRTLDISAMRIVTGAGRLVGRSPVPIRTVRARWVAADAGDN